jgi:glycosyltransferase involved in cell wall biosynthesis
MIDVSFLISTFNSEATIGRCIDSILSQSFTNFEVIIVDDGSTDATKSIISSFRDDRIKYFYQQNSGISKALNFGLLKAKGKYIAKLDSDDLCLSDRILLQYNFLESHPEYVLCGSAARIMSDENIYLNDQIEPEKDLDIRTKMSTCNAFIHSSAFYRRSSALSVMYDEEIVHFFEDYLFFSQLLKLGKAYNFKNPLIIYYVSPFSISRNKMSFKQKSLMMSIVRRGYGVEGEAQYFNSLKIINRSKSLSNYYLLNFRTLIKNSDRYILALKYLNMSLKQRFWNPQIYVSILFMIYYLIFKKYRITR